MVSDTTAALLILKELTTLYHILNNGLNKVWKNKHMDDEEKIGANACTDDDKTVLKENGLKAKGIEIGIEAGRLVLDEGDDPNVDSQQSCGHEQLGPSVTNEI